MSLSAERMMQCAWLVEATYLNAGTFWLNGGRDLFFRGKRDVKGKAKEAEDAAKKDL